tara:strand:+ start:222 stop:698 length:477 start_codon:yes stop_codon:yes gene_type:complete
LLTNPGNIVLICRKCHRQTTSYLSRYKYKFQGDARNQEIDVLVINIEGLEKELAIVKEENSDLVNEMSKIAQEEISNKESEIGELKEENQELQDQLELIDKISLEYQVFRATKKALKKSRRDLYRVSRGIEGGIKREVKGAVKTAKKVGSGIRKKTGL